MTASPVLHIREWSTTTPETPGVGALLRGLRLSEVDRELLAELEGRASLRFTELRSGLAIAVGPHIGTVNLSGLRLVIMPKIRIENLMRMVAYAFDLSDLLVTETRTTYAVAEHGLIDLLGLSLLRAVERIARGGLLPKYQSRSEDLATPRGRLDLRHIATHPRRATLRCAYDDLTTDHELNQVLAAGLRLAAAVMQSVDLRLDLARAADRFFGDLARTPLDAERLRTILDGLDRRSSHYRTALTVIALIHHGARLGDHAEAGAMPLSSFTLNMNMVFERFLGRYLSENAPEDIRVVAQDVRSDVFSYLENPGGWNQPTIRPDFVFRQRRRVVAVADAKYKNRHEHPPTTSELYQLTTYGMAYPMPEPREVLLLHPLAAGELDRPTTLLFAPSAVMQHVRIRLVGVPVDSMLEDASFNWWPLDQVRSSTVPANAPTRFATLGGQQLGGL
jgi:5-methylcytosine-specific restriction enzyme subunit McrC